jgi:hypothetical protein
VQEVKDYLYNSLSETQLKQLTDWVNYLKANGAPTNGDWVAVKTEIVAGSIKGLDKPASLLLGHVQKA